jgi:TonB family protein
MRNPLLVSLATLLFVSVPSLLPAQDCCVTITVPVAAPAKSGDIATPIPVKATTPPYPSAARTAGHQGTSILTFMVGIDGKPYDIKVVRRLDDELDESASAAVSTWRFEPARKDGEVLEAAVRARISFRLYDDNNRRLATLWDRSDANDPRADLELSKDYLEGLGVPQDPDLSLQFLKMAADWNIPQAQFLLGEHFYKSSNPPDYVAAYLWYGLSKRSGGKQGEEMLHVLASEMTPQQLGEAETRIGYWPEEPPHPGH